MIKYTKNHRVEIRITDVLFRKLAAICSVTGRSKTSIIEELITQEFKKNKKYEEKYYFDLNKNS